MDFWDLSKLLLRRWYIVLPMVLLAALATTWIALTVKPDYTATTHVRLVPPHRIAVGNGTREPANPYLDLGLGSLSELARVSLEGENVAKALIAAGFSDTFTITVDQASPLVTIEAVGNTEQQAIGTAGQLAVLFRQSVVDFQTDQGVGHDDLILTDRVLIGDKVAASTMKVTRAVIAVGAFGLLFSVAFTVAVDAVSSRRRRSSWPQGDLGETPRSGSPPRGQPIPGQPIPGQLVPGQSRRGRSARGQRDSESHGAGAGGGGLRAGGLGGGGLRGGGSGLAGGSGYGGVPPQTPVFTIGGAFAPALNSGRALAGDPDDVDNSADVTLAGVGRAGIDLSSGGVRVDAPGTGRGVSIEYRVGARPSANAEPRQHGAAAELARRDDAPERQEPEEKSRLTEDESTILLPLSFKGRPNHDGGSFPR